MSTAEHINKPGIEQVLTILPIDAQANRGGLVIGDGVPNITIEAIRAAIDRPGYLPLAVNAPPSTEIYPPTDPRHNLASLAVRSARRR